MPRCAHLLFLCVAPAASLFAATSTSANYSIAADSIDTGGAHVSSANYAVSGSLGGVDGLSSVSTPSETLKSGFIGQLYQVTGLEILPPANGNDAQQLTAAQTLDDGTLLDLTPGNESWSVINGQLPAGLTLDMSTGLISGTASGSGSYSYTILVTDGLGDSAQQIFSASAPPDAPTDTPTMPPFALAALALLLLFLAGRKQLVGIGSLPSRRSVLPAA